MQCINSYRAAKPSAVGSTFVDGGIALYAIDLFGSLLTPNPPKEGVESVS